MSLPSPSATEASPLLPTVLLHNMTEASTSDRALPTLSPPRNGDNAFVDDDITSNDFDMPIEQLRRNSAARWERGGYYDWWTFFPRQGGLLSCLQWFRSGHGGDKAPHETDTDIKSNLYHLATMLQLLRQYYSTYGLPECGGPKDQEYVLREIVKDLYGGGVPIWTLEPAMERGAEGLTGKKGVGFCIFPRSAFIFAPSSGATSMFRVARHFDIHKLTGAERVLVRMASFASNTHGMASRVSRLPHPDELQEAERRSSLITTADYNGDSDGSEVTSQEAMADRILTLASMAEGLFFFINSTDRPDTTSHSSHGMSTPIGRHGDIDTGPDFWKVEPHIAELFSRLATIEAMQAVDDLSHKRQYSIPLILLFRFIASAAACVFWYNGGWIDSLVAGCCGLLVGVMSLWHVQTKEESMLFEAIASLFVGLIAGLVSLWYPTQTCFGAMGVAGVVDVLQGFRIVYAVLELLSKHSISGSADFLEGLLYTGLIAYCLKVGQLAAIYSMATSPAAVPDYVPCESRVDPMWNALLVPAAAISWSGLFNPDYVDLPWMALHGILAFSVTWLCNQGQLPHNFTLFLSSFAVTFSSGMVSRFTGRQALGNTVAGLYLLTPGAFLVESLFSELSFDFMGQVILNAAILGTGAWVGTILCSPIILGTTAALLKKRVAPGRGRHSEQRERLARKDSKGAMLFF